MLTGLVGIAIMAIATPTPTPALDAPPEETPAIADRSEPDQPSDLPASSLALLAGIAAGALVLRRMVGR